MERKRVSFIHSRPASRRAATRAGDDYGATAEPDWRGVDWRRHLREVELGGRRVHLVDVGEGDREPALLVHGLSGVWQNWLETIPRLAAERRVIAPDLPGFGRSEMPAEKISMSGYADSLDELCERLGVERAVVVGNSMGGFVSAELAIRHPERVSRLVLVAAAGIAITNLRREPVLALARVGAAAGVREVAEHERLMRRPGLRHMMFALVFRHPTRLAPEVLVEQMQGAGAPGFVDALDALTGYDFVDRLSEIRCPTLIVWGENDPLVPVDDAHEFERLIPSARAVVLKDTGHVPQVERAPTFNDLVAEFLAADEGPRSAAGRAHADDSLETAAEAATA